MNWTEWLNKLSWLLPVKISFLDVLQALILSLLFFYLFKSIYKTRAWVLAKGLITMGLIYFVTSVTELSILHTIMNGLFSVVLVAIVIMLQPELQKLVETVGTKDWRSIIKGVIKRQKKDKFFLSEQSISEIANACADMSAAKTGALIVIERRIPLKEISESGISLKAEISSQLLVNTFEKNTPLHDGAVVIIDNKVDSATCYLPLTKNPTINKHLGTRHRAAIGVSETTDCVVIVVSEENGAMSVCADGNIKYNLSKSDLLNVLHEELLITEDIITSTSKKKTPLWIKLISPIMGVVVALAILGSTDPVITSTISDVPIQMVNADVLTELNQVYTIDGSKTLSVKVTGKRSKVNQLTADNIKAIADVKEMSMVYAIPVKVSLPNDFSDINIDTDNAVLKLRLEDTEQIEIPVVVEQLGINEKYRVHELSPNNTTITVYGAKSLIKTLDKAVVSVDVENRSSNFTENITPVIYDKNGSIVEEGISLNVEKIQVNGIIYSTKKVPVVVDIVEQNTNGAEYYILKKVTLEENTINVAAPHSVLSNLTQIEILVTPDASTVDAASLTIKLSSYLPKDVYLAPTQVDELSMSLDLTRYIKMSIPLAEKDIKITGYDSKRQTYILTKYPKSIDLYYDTSKLTEKELTVARLSPSLTLTSVNGDSTTQLQINGIDGVNIVSDLLVNYTVSEIGEKP